MSESVRLNGAGERSKQKALGEFLKARRERVSPEDVGLPSVGRRRTPGLRREEVALLANVGISWYTSLEQGREAKPSEAVLEGIARALRLSPGEEWHLFVLAGHVPPSCIPAPREEVSPSLKRIIDGLGDSPAYAIGADWELAHWNAAADAVFGFSDGVPPRGRNLIWRLFMDPAARDHYTSWEDVARDALARFRAEYAGRPGDPRFEGLVRDLERESAEFRAWWPRYEVAGRAEGREEILHPLVGRISFQHTTLGPPGDPDLKMIVYTPTGAADAEKLSKILLAED